MTHIHKLRNEKTLNIRYSASKNEVHYQNHEKM